MFLRSASLLFLLVCASARPQTAPPAESQTAPQESAPVNPNIPRAFRDPNLAVTYFYPGPFTPVAPPATAPTSKNCAQPNLSGSAISPNGSSVFVLSSIDATCPAVLRGAAQELGAFTREQILRQLKQYGTPEITQDPTQYFVDDHPAAVTIASVQQDDSANVNHVLPPKTTYAAKACILGNVPAKSHGKSSIADQTSRILCFDFTTQQRDLLPLMLAFTMQFEGHTPQPLVPGSALR
jgi:hypothetical protein